MKISNGSNLSNYYIVNNVMCSIDIISFNPPNNSMRWILLLSTFSCGRLSARRGWVTCTRAYNQQAVDLEFEPRQISSKPNCSTFMLQLPFCYKTSEKIFLLRGLQWEDLQGFLPFSKYRITSNGILKAAGFSGISTLLVPATIYAVWIQPRAHLQPFTRRPSLRCKWGNLPKQE